MLAGQDLDEQAVARITRQSNGWVAALVLLREHMSRAGATLDESIGEGKDAIFQYFAGEIFNRARPENQRVLMLTAVSPSFTPAEAVALTGSEIAAELLDYLYRGISSRPSQGHAHDLSLPRAVPRIPARRGEEAAVERRAARGGRARRRASERPRAGERCARPLP
jgi:predicted RNase H-like HicB family nuclease